MSQGLAGVHAPADLILVLSLYLQILTASSKPHVTHAKEKIKHGTILLMKFKWMRNVKGYYKANGMERS